MANLKDGIRSKESTFIDNTRNDGVSTGEKKESDRSQDASVDLKITRKMSYQKPTANSFSREKNIDEDNIWESDLVKNQLLKMLSA